MVPRFWPGESLGFFLTKDFLEAVILLGYYLIPRLLNFLICFFNSQLGWGGSFLYLGKDFSFMGIMHWCDHSPFHGSFLPVKFWARKGYPTIILSLPRLVTKNWSFLVWFWCHISSSTFCVILPDLLRLLSTFLAVLGQVSGVVGMLNFLMSWWWMKFSVALLSTSAWVLALFVLQTKYYFGMYCSNVRLECIVWKHCPNDGHVIQAAEKSTPLSCIAFIHWTFFSSEKLTILLTRSSILSCS